MLMLLERIYLFRFYDTFIFSVQSSLFFCETHMNFSLAHFVDTIHFGVNLCKYPENLTDSAIYTVLEAVLVSKRIVCLCDAKSGS